MGRRYQLFANRSSKIGGDQQHYTILPPAQRFFDLANVEYFLTTKVLTAHAGKAWPLWQQHGAIRIYRNPTVLPRVFAVPAVQVVQEHDAIRAVYAPDFDARHQAVVEHPIAGLPTALPTTPFSSTAHITAYAQSQSQ